MATLWRIFCPSLRMRTSILIPALIAAALVGCGDRTPPTPVAPEPSASATTDGPAPAPGSPAPGSPAPAVDVGMLPAPDTIAFAGFGPAVFGADEEAVRMAWGKALEGAPDAPGSCYVLVPAPRGKPPYLFDFMFEGGKFSRIDVRTDAVAAPGGGALGMSADDIVGRYPGAQAMPHKYVEGARTLRVKDSAGGNGALVFETDANGIVVAWRIGVPPQVDYVEGCG